MHMFCGFHMFFACFFLQSHMFYVCFFQFHIFSVVSFSDFIHFCIFFLQLIYFFGNPYVFLWFHMCYLWFHIFLWFIVFCDPYVLSTIHMFLPSSYVIWCNEDCAWLSRSCITFIISCTHPTPPQVSWLCMTMGENLFIALSRWLE